MEYRLDLVLANDLAATLNAANLDGWSLVSVKLHVGGSEPCFYALWSRAI